MDGQDWAPVVIQGKQAPANVHNGTEKKNYIKSDARKIEEQAEEGDFTKQKTDFVFKKALQQARMVKKMGQGDLAKVINKKANVITEYESGKSIPTNGEVAKLEKALGVKLPRPKK
jgi:putative transcription factor